MLCVLVSIVAALYCVFSQYEFWTIVEAVVVSASIIAFLVSLVFLWEHCAEFRDRNCK